MVLIWIEYFPSHSPVSLHSPMSQIKWRRDGIITSVIHQGDKIKTFGGFSFTEHKLNTF